MEGWISLYRKIQEHWLWKQKRKFSQFEAWLSLLFKASYKDKKIHFDGEIIDIKAGELITSELKLANEWGWSRNTVRAFLKKLEATTMCTRYCTTKYTSLTIVNWATYQFMQQRIEQHFKQHFEHKQ